MMNNLAINNTKNILSKLIICCSLPARNPTKLLYILFLLVKLLVAELIKS